MAEPGYSDVIPWPVIGLHSLLTPDGKVLTFGTNTSGVQSGELYYDVYDPVSGTHTTLTHTTKTDLFCCVALIIPGTGKVLLAGGDARPLGAVSAGVPDVNVYDPLDMSIERSGTGPMAYARWYASMVGLANGQLLAIGGSDENYKYNGYSEIYTEGSGWRTLTGAYIEQFNTASNYPRTWVASDGKIITFSADWGAATVYAIDPTGSGSVEAIGGLPFATAWSLPAIMFDVDRALILATDGAAWIMNISGDTPVFTQTDGVDPNRTWSNFEVLPDGTVLLSGGSATENQTVDANYSSAIWNPDTGHWTDADDAAVPRLYHSSTLLLPDGTVLSLGGGAPGPVVNLNGEVFTPDYLFDASGAPADRPVILSAPDELEAGDHFAITVDDPGSIETLALLAFGATTHSFNMSARRIELSFTVEADGTLSVDLPDNSNVLTPGYWMLFALDSNGVPSIASTIHIGVEQAPYLPSTLPLNLGVALETNGLAAYDGYEDAFVLTPDAPSKTGSIMSEERIDLRKAFSMSFEFNVGADDAAADGLAFVLHNDPAGASALGSGGGGLGALGILNGLGIEFDIFDNPGPYLEPTSDHTNIFDTDDLTSDPAVTAPTSLGNIEDGQWHQVQILWNGADKLSYTVDGIAVGSWTGDITTYLAGSTFAHFGFSGGTSGLMTQQVVRVLELDATAEDGTTLHADRFTGVNIVGNSAANTITGGGENDMIAGLGGADRLFGLAGNDTLDGGIGNDRLDGGAGNDVMRGGSGDDTYVVDSAGDIVIESSGQGTDTVLTTVATYTLGQNLEYLTFTGAGNFVGLGNSLANLITGGTGNDTLDGGAGADRLAGGRGDDTYLVDSASDVVVEASNAGTDTVLATSATHTLSANVEILSFTGTGDFVGMGNAAANVIMGGKGNDTLDGGAGADKLLGGAGNDIYIVDNTGDVIIEAASGGTDTVKTVLAVYTLGAEVENLTYTGTAAFAGTGNAANNIITGGKSSDTLNGGTGTDTLIGGAGNDTYIVDDLSDVITELTAGGTDTVKTTATNYALGAETENLTFTGAGAFTGTGNAMANTITGGAGDDTLDGGAGADKLIGGAGNDTYIVDNAGDLITEAANAGIDTVKTAIAALTLATNTENLTFIGSGAFSGTGNVLNNTITGGTGDDTLNGGAGADTLIGGTGNDTYVVDNIADVITEGVSAGTDTVKTTAIAYTLGANLENLTFTGSTAFTGTGNTLDNVISGGNSNDKLLGDAGGDTLNGGGGNDILDGGTGADALIGGAGNDTYIVDNAGDVVTEAVNAGTDIVLTTLVASTLSANVENLTFVGTGTFAGNGNILNNVINGGSSNDTLFGDAGNDTLNGGAGDDILDGGAGKDTFVGGIGDDTYIVDTVGEVVAEGAAAGNDTVETTLAAYTLGLNLENLTFIGAGAFSGTGNALNNTITGGALADTLNGGAGADALIGGLGNDTYVIDNTGDVVTEAASDGTDTVKTTLASFTLGSNVENLTFTGSVAFAGFGNELDNVITGGSNNDSLHGSIGSDTLNGAAGNDTLDGGEGADTLLGGAGNDVYVVDNAGDVVTEAANAGTDTVQTALAAYALGVNVENLTFTGTTAFIGTGNVLNNVIIGGVGSDMLNGGAGVDTLVGGLGDDLYIVDNAKDVVKEYVDAGTDTVQTTLASYMLGANVEHLTYLGSVAFTGTGNALDNTITGGIGNDTLNGGAGADTLIGGAGNDIYLVDNAGDTATEFADSGTDTVKVTIGSYVLSADVENLAFAGTGSFTGIGNGLDNVITGGAQGDTLCGDGGNDTLNGGAGNDGLDGGTGADLMIGGSGNDAYAVDNAGDVATEGANAGTDWVLTTLSSFTLVANVENLSFFGAGGFAGTGNALNNIIFGGTGNDVLDGGAGNDTLDGGGGDDVLIGGWGNDAYVIESAGDVVIENSGQGTDTVLTTVATYTLGQNLEYLTFTGTGNFVGLGNSLANLITGGTGNDTLDGGAGADRLTGGLGDDTYYVDSASDVVVEASNAGTDTVLATSASYTLSANIENLRYIGTGSFSGTGDAFANTIVGGSHNDVLSGGGGDDTLLGLDGNDTLNGGSGADRIDGGIGADKMIGGSGNDLFIVDDVADVVIENAGDGTDTVETSLTSYTLSANVENLTFTGTGSFTATGNSSANTITGGAAADTLNGGSGNDRLIGGAGDDTLIGGAGNDTFVFNAGFGNDVITDFGDVANNDDILQFSTSVFADFAAVQLASAQMGADIVISVTASDSLTIKNKTIATLDANDFHFV